MSAGGGPDHDGSPPPDDIERLEGEGEGVASDEEQTDTDSDAPPPPPPPPPQQQQQAGAGGLRFLSYRDEIRGFSGSPPRRMRHWLLVDSQGREHVAVDTTKYEASKKRFTYEAVPPFSQVRPLYVRTQRDVLLYLDQFVPPEARSATSLAVDAFAEGSPAPATLPKAAATPGSEKRKAEPARTPTSGGKQAKRPREAGGPLSAAVYIADAARRRTVHELRVAAVEHELSMLHAECAVGYSLTLVGPDRGLTVLTSGVRGAAAPGAAAARGPTRALNDEHTPLKLEDAAAALMK
jgi:hypothetical protein